MLLTPLLLFYHQKKEMRAITQYVWENRLFPKTIYTTDRSPAHIIYAGEQDMKSESCYRNAKVKFGNELYIGEIIVHNICKGKQCGYSMQITFVPYLKKEDEHYRFLISIPEEIVEGCRSIMKGIREEKCTASIHKIDSINQRSFMSRLLVERIEDKAGYIKHIFEKCDKRWDETLFKLLIRNFGFGIQGEAFETWGATLNFNALGKHRDNIGQIEAIFFGQAGLLEPESIPAYYRQFAIEERYYNDLIREYKFLSSKFNLHQTDWNIWKCGNSTPHIRIARIASLYHDGKLSMSAIATCNTTNEIRSLLQTQAQGYWRTHMHFGGTETIGTPPLRNSQLDLLIINTIIPIMYTYGKHRCDKELCSKAEDFMYTLNSEENSIIRRWTQKGFNVKCAADSQAIIQLQKNYCDKHKCRECHLAYEYIKNRMIEK